ncbi:3-hydroxyacyl-CoA dehydrogenase NAD-binding domain-containing protein, partial [Candidatus Hodarchaeum mangrovi]
MNISKIGILGAGVMGPGIAEVFAIFGASHNFAIIICDISPTAIKEAIQRLEEDLVKVGSTGLYSEEDLAKAKGQITFTTEINEI